MQHKSEQAQSIASYIFGSSSIFAFTLVDVTNLVQFIGVILGVVLLVVRIAHDMYKFKKDREKDK